MPKAIFRRNDGTAIDVEVAMGVSLMKAAVANSVDGIVGDCGGALSCATCHVMVDPAFEGALPPVSDNEDQMLDCTAAERQPNSRLSCQLVMCAELDGIVVTIPDQQF
jgi:2Fe-2S ferredoxin